MTDPRNVAHDKKVLQEKKNHGEEAFPGAEHAPQPGKKPHIAEEPESEEEDNERVLFTTKYKKQEVSNNEEEGWTIE